MKLSTEALRTQKVATADQAKTSLSVALYGRYRSLAPVARYLQVCSAG